MIVLPPPGDTPAERVAAFLQIHHAATLTYGYPPSLPPGTQWNLAADDVRQLLDQHQRMLSMLQRVQDHMVDEILSKIPTISLEELQESLDKDQHQG